MGGQNHQADIPKDENVAAAENTAETATTENAQETKTEDTAPEAPVSETETQTAEEAQS